MPEITAPKIIDKIHVVNIDPEPKIAAKIKIDAAIFTPRLRKAFLGFLIAQAFIYRVTEYVVLPQVFT